MNTTNKDLHLYHILNANAMFSFTSGLFFVLGRNPLGEFLNTTPSVMIGLALVMFFYAGLIAFHTQRNQVTRNFTLFTVLGDSGWVLLSIALLILPIFNFTADAKWAIGITAICIDAFATLQFLEWRKMK
jgi:hypothetical protein